MTFHGKRDPGAARSLPGPAIEDFLNNVTTDAAHDLLIGKIGHVRSLAGHSGCEVSLMVDGDDYYVRKVSASFAYNERLFAQMKKQERLSTLIPTPRVIRSGEEAGLFWFDMEFIRGDGFLTFAPLQSIASIPDFVHHLIKALETLGCAGKGHLSSALFEGKLRELQRTVPISEWYADHADILDHVFERLAYSDWSGIPCTPCHGDLTVENMLMRNDGGIVFIDLLDGDLETVWMDAAKLVQDLESGWSMRSILWMEETDAAARLLRMLGRYLSDEFQAQMKALHPGFGSRLPAMRALQALRVLPYVHDPSTYRRVVSGIAGIEFKESPE